MNRTLLRQLRAEKYKVDRRLRRAQGGLAARASGPELQLPRARYEMSRRTRAISCGGIGVINRLLRSLGFADKLDQSLQLLRWHRPYHESDHILNIVYNNEIPLQVIGVIANVPANSHFTFDFLVSFDTFKPGPGSLEPMTSWALLAASIS